MQVVVGAPDKQRFGLDCDLAVWLPSDWWVTLRNQFAQARDAATEILKSVEQPLAEITADSQWREVRALRI